MSKYIFRIILFLSISSYSYGQDLDNISLFASKSRVSLINSILDKEDNNFTLFKVSNPSSDGLLTIDLEAVADTFGCKFCRYYVLAKFTSNNKLISFRKISSLMLDESNNGRGLNDVRLRMANNKIFIVGEWRDHITLDGEVISEPAETFPEYSKGVMLRFNQDLEFEEIYKFDNNTKVRDVVYYEGEYIIGGHYAYSYFKYLDFILKPDDGHVPQILHSECFLIAVDTTTSLPTRGISFGGQSETTMFNMAINAEGDIVMAGENGEYFFTFNDVKIQTEHSNWVPKLYILRITKDFDFISFSDFESIFYQPYFPEIEFDVKNDKSYVFSWSTIGALEVNDIIYEESSGIDKGFLLKINKEGNVDWYKRFEAGEEEEELGLTFKEISHNSDESIILSLQYRNKFKVEDTEFNELPDNGSNNSIIISFDSDTGNEMSYITFLPEISTSITSINEKSSGTLSLTSTISIPSSVNYDLLPSFLQEWFDSNVKMIYLDLNSDFISQIITPFQDQDYSLYPNPSNGSFQLDFLKDDLEGYTFELYDVLGKLVYLQKVEYNRFLECKTCSSGMYFGVLKYEGEVQSVNTLQIIK